MSEEVQGESTVPPGDQEPQELSFEFSGSGGEYFRIWIVNICLTIVTLGIYSAWAKVRTKQYFYGNTKLDGTSFRYHAKPTRILIGRLIAVAVFGLYMGAGMINPFLGLAVLGALMVAMPWVINRSLAFNARMSSWREIRFAFQGSYGESFLAFFLYPFLVPFSLGLALPFSLSRQEACIVNNSKFGTTGFRFSGTASTYYKPALVTVIGSVAVMVFGIIFAAILGVAISGESGESTEAVGSILGLLPFIGFILVGAYVRAFLFRAKFQNSSLSSFRFGSGLKTREFLAVFLGNTVLVVLTLGLFLPWAKVRMARCLVNSLTVRGQADTGEFIQAEKENVSAAGEAIGEAFDFDIAPV